MRASAWLICSSRCARRRDERLQFIEQEDGRVAIQNRSNRAYLRASVNGGADTSKSSTIGEDMKFIIEPVETKFTKGVAATFLLARA